MRLIYEKRKCFHVATRYIRYGNGFGFGTRDRTDSANWWSCLIKLWEPGGELIPNLMFPVCNCV